jgi:hypothetical protein
MNSLKLPLHRRLRRDQFLRFEHPRGLCLRAEQGALWVTIDGEPDDITIEPGASRVFGGDDGVLVGTFRGEAMLSASAARAVPRWRGWLGLGPPHSVTAS